MLLPAADLKIEGRHNIANALAAFAIADAIVSGKTANMVVTHFESLPASLIDVRSLVIIVVYAGSTTPRAPT